MQKNHFTKPFCVKKQNTQKLGMEGNFFNLIKGIKKLTADILNGQKLKALPHSETRMSAFATSIHHCTGGSRLGREREIQIYKAFQLERNKTSSCR